MELEEYRKKVANLSINEQKLRDLYLRDLALGKVQGPPTGYASLDKPWLKYYPEEAITYDIPNKSIYDLIHDSNLSNLSSVALRYFNNKITYGELFDSIEKAAKGFVNMGVKSNDIVTMLMPNTPEAIYCFYALNRLGAIVNVVDPRLKREQIRDILNNTESKYVVSLDMCNPILDSIKKETKVKKILSVSPVESLPLPIRMLAKFKNNFKAENDNDFVYWSKFLKEGKNVKYFEDDKYYTNKPVAILYTGGTTGNPKGVVLTNDNFNTMAVTQVISGYNIDKGDSFLNFLPPFIAYCLVNAIHDPLFLGCDITLIPTFDAKDFPKLMVDHKPNHVLAGPILWNFFIDSDLTQNLDLSFLKSPISGGDKLSVELEEKVNDFFHHHNCKYNVIQGYGMTEVSAAACYSSEESQVVGSVGIPYVKNNISIFDPDTGKELRYGEKGEICISTPTMMLKYYNNDEATKDVIRLHDDGKYWVHTGDVGTITENGNVFVEGRMKRMIVRNGNKLFPSNVEDLILTDESISNCAIVSMPNKDEKSVPVAFIVLKSDSKFDSKHIDDIISAKLPEFNIPYKYIIRNDLPLTTINKIDFRTLESDALNYIDDDSKVIDEREKSKIKKK